jgi:hypothetical protein
MAMQWNHAISGKPLVLSQVVRLGGAGGAKFNGAHVRRVPLRARAHSCSADMDVHAAMHMV